MILILLGAVGLLWFVKSQPRASVTTSEGFDFGAYGGQTSYPQPIVRLAQAIARQEGFYVAGSVPQRANNPGDLKVPGLPTLPGTSITKFQSADEGWNALYKQIQLIVTGRSAYYTVNMTIDQMARVWTATEQQAWASNVAMFLGTTTQATLRQVLA